MKYVIVSGIKVGCIDQIKEDGSNERKYLTAISMFEIRIKGNSCKLDLRTNPEWNNKVSKIYEKKRKINKKKLNLRLRRTKRTK